ncbi:hypothetical protein OC835_005138, partial [Tilletia horrida]
VHNMDWARAIGEAKAAIERLEHTRPEGETRVRELLAQAERLHHAGHSVLREIERENFLEQLREGRVQAPAQAPGNAVAPGPPPQP